VKQRQKAVRIVDFSDLAVRLNATKIIYWHNLKANFVIILEVCKHSAQDFVNASASGFIGVSESGRKLRRSV
jgi:hypothetical protein